MFISYQNMYFHGHTVQYKSLINDEQKYLLNVITISLLFAQGLLGFFIANLVKQTVCKLFLYVLILKYNDLTYK